MRVLVLAALVLAAGQAYGQPVDPFDAPHGATARGGELFLEGRELAKAGRLDEACERFQASWSVERAIGTELNLADCREREGKLREAWAMFQHVAQTSTAQGNTTRAAFARNRAQSLEARMGILQIELAQPIDTTTRVTVGGRDVGDPGTPVHRELVDAGSIEIKAITSAGKVFSKVVIAAAGKPVIVVVPSMVKRPLQRSRSWKFAAAGFAVGGLVAIALSPVLAATAESRDPGEGLNCAPDNNGVYFCSTPGDYQQLNDNLTSVDRLELASSLCLYGGAALVVTGLVVYLKAPKSAVTVTPTASSDRVGLAVAGRF